MKRNYLFISLLLSLCLACTEKRSLTVSVSNPLPMERTGEMVELSMDELAARLQLADTAQVIVTDAEGNELPTQVTYDNKLIFPATVPASATATYTLSTGTPAPVEVKACGRQYPERLDDLAWENDLVAFRAYGPALQARGERGFGYDLFTKYNTTEPILEEMYAMELDPGKWTRVNELRKSDPAAADSLAKTFSYHIDHGYGMDCYAVGPTLGAGVAALMAGDTICYPWCYRTLEILDNGPLRFTARLTFNPMTVRTDTAVVETRLITLDAGSHLNRTAVSYANLSQPLSITTGIVLHEPDGATVADAANGYITYVDPTNGPDNGKIYIGAAFPAVVREAKNVLFPAEEKKQRNNADGHVLAISDYEPGAEYTYYWGFAWSKADIRTPEAWNTYMAAFAQKVRQPLVVTVAE